MQKRTLQNLFTGSLSLLILVLGITFYPSVSEAQRKKTAAPASRRPPAKRATKKKKKAKKKSLRWRRCRRVKTCTSNCKKKYSWQCSGPLTKIDSRYLHLPYKKRTQKFKCKGNKTCYARKRDKLTYDSNGDPNGITRSCCAMPGKKKGTCKCRGYVAGPSEARHGYCIPKKQQLWCVTNHYYHTGWGPGVLRTVDLRRGQNRRSRVYGCFTIRGALRNDKLLASVLNCEQADSDGDITVGNSTINCYKLRRTLLRKAVTWKRIALRSIIRKQDKVIKKQGTAIRSLQKQLRGNRQQLSNALGFKGKAEQLQQRVNAIVAAYRQVATALLGTKRADEPIDKLHPAVLKRLQHILGKVKELKLRNRQARNLYAYLCGILPPKLRRNFGSALSPDWSNLPKVAVAVGKHNRLTRIALGRVKKQRRSALGRLKKKQKRLDDLTTAHGFELRLFIFQGGADLGLQSFQGQGGLGIAYGFAGRRVYVGFDYLAGGISTAIAGLQFWHSLRAMVGGRLLPVDYIVNVFLEAGSGLNFLQGNWAGVDFVTRFGVSIRAHKNFHIVLYGQVNAGSTSAITRGFGGANLTVLFQ